MNLANQDSWHRVGEVLNYLDKQGAGYMPLKPLNFVVSSPVVSVKISTPLRSRPTWFTGGWASLWGKLTDEEERLHPSHRCRLNAKDLVQFPDFGLVSYRLQIDFPKWIPIVHVFIWEYIDQSVNPTDASLTAFNTGFPSLGELG